MNRKIYLIGMMILAMLFASCKKEEKTEVQEEFSIMAVTENDGSKTYLDGNRVKWIVDEQNPQNSDVIKVFDRSSNAVNFTCKTVESTGTEANFTSTTPVDDQGEYWAFYPATQDVNPTRSGNTFTFTMPATQTYKEGNTFNNNIFPMAAHFPSGSKSGVKLQFKNAFGILKISATGNCKIYSIVLTDNNTTNNALSGNFTFNPDNINNNPTAAAGNNSNVLTLKITDGKQLDPNNPTYFYMILPPGCLAGAFDLNFYDVLNPGPTTRPVKEINNTGAIQNFAVERSTMKTATVDATKVHAFTVNADGKKVIFAPGNLCSDMGGGNWRFQPNQWTQTAVENGVRGMFYFSNNVTNNNGGINWTGDGTEYVNWGDMLPSSLGTGWYLLSDEEWYYLLYTRSGASSKYRAATTVNEIRGLVIVPDDWTGGISSSYSGSSWTTAESNGAVFLPRSGGGMQYNNGGTTLWPHSYEMYMFEGWQNGTTKQGQYWMVTAHPTWWDTNPRYHSVLYFNINKENGTNDVSVDRTGCGGQSMLRAVRLVKDAN